MHGVCFLLLCAELAEHRQFRVREFGRAVVAAGAPLYVDALRRRGRVCRGILVTEFPRIIRRDAPPITALPHIDLHWYVVELAVKQAAKDLGVEYMGWRGAEYTFRDSDAVLRRATQILVTDVHLFLEMRSRAGPGSILGW